MLIICLSWRAEAQTLTHQFIDPCTGQVTYFSVPAQGTVIFFLGQSRSFVPGDVQNGTLATWINQVYADYRRVAPCGQQQGQVTQNQITAQIVSSTVQSVVGSIMSQAQSAASSTITGIATSASTTNASSAGGSDAATKNNKDGDNKKNDNNTTTSGGGSNTTGNGGNSSSGGATGGSSNSGGSETTKQTDTKTEAKSEEVAATTTMNVDQQNQNSSKDDNGGGGGGGGKGGKNGGKGGTTNPLIVSSDFTTAQNLDKSFTPILNLSMNQSSMTGMSSWGVTSMIWFNFKQFALSGKYTKIKFSKNGKLKWINNFNLTGVYSYGNIIGFIGYSGILNAGKYGITGFNTSVAMTKINGEQKNTFVSSSLTAFYTKPFSASKRLTISPELYIISTPLLYSTTDKVTTTDRTFSAFIGSGFDYQLTRRFKFNMNYKANLSTNPDFPILSFFLIGSKINL